MLLTVTRAYPPEVGGVEVVAQKVAEIGKEVFGASTVLAFSKDRSLKQEEINGVEVIRIPTWIRHDPIRVSPYFGKYLKKLSKETSATLFHFPISQPEIFFKFNNITSYKVCLYHGDVIGRGIVGDIYRKDIAKVFLSKMDKIITTSPNLLNSSPLLAEFKSKTETIPLFVDTDNFHPREEYTDNIEINNFLKGSHGIKPKVILYIGRFGRYKGLDYLINSLQYLPEEFKLILIGDGIKKAEIENIISTQSYGNRVLMMPHVSYKDLAKYYSLADVFVLPSIDRGEAFGLVAIEAMACGIPVITTELGTGTTYHNVNGVTGLHVPPMNSKAIADTVLKICNEDWKNTHKKDIINRAQEFSFEQFRNKWIMLFSKFEK